MTITISESMWLNETEACSIEQLAEMSGLSLDEIGDLIDCGIIAPVDQNRQPCLIQLRYVTIAITARRLRDDFLLDRHGLTLALHLLKRIDMLETQLNASGDAQSSSHHYDNK